MSEPAWKWIFYTGNKGGKGGTTSGELTTISDLEKETFWKGHWTRNRTPPKWLVDYTDSHGVLVAGYKTRRGENTDAYDVIKSMIPGLKDTEKTRIRGDIMVLRRVHHVDKAETIPDTSGTIPAATDATIPDELKKEEELAPEYCIRCEGSSDEATSLIKIMDREGITCEADTPGPNTVAHVRNVARTKLWNVLKDPVMAVDAEKGILRETIRLALLYNRKCTWKDLVVREMYRTLYSKVWRNLLPKDHPQSVGNPKLLSHVKSGLLNASDLASMNPQSMWPEKWRVLEEARIMKQIATLETSAVASTDAFTCRRCGKNECTYREVQTRSADEPMTIFVLCLSCGNRWKE